MASLIYNSARVLFAKGQVDWENDDIRVLLVTSSYAPDVDAHDFVNDVTNEVAGSGYVRKALTGRTVTQNNTDNRADMSADCPTWIALNAGTPAAAVIYKEGASDAARSLLAYIDLPDAASIGEDWKLQFSAQPSNGVVARL